MFQSFFFNVFLCIAFYLKSRILYRHLNIFFIDFIINSKYNIKAMFKKIIITYLYKEISKTILYNIMKKM